MTGWSINWKNSKSPRKQRKYRYNSPLHVRKRFLHVNLSKELRTKHTMRSIGIRKKDKVKILRGQFRKKTGVVSKVNVKKCKVYVEGIEQVRKDGTKSFYPLSPSNLQIIELNLDDKRRLKLKEDGKKTPK